LSTQATKFLSSATLVFSFPLEPALGIDYSIIPRITAIDIYIPTL
jgi:hypothetical protein